MKKKVIIILSTLMSIGLTACSSSQQNVGEKVLTAFEENGFTAYYHDYDNRLYYDLEGNFYEREYDDGFFPGEKLDSSRLSFEPDRLELEIHNDKGEHFKIYVVDKDNSPIDKEMKRIHYSNSNKDTYIKGMGNTKEEFVEFNRGFNLDQPNLYFFEEDEDTIEHIRKEDILGEDSRNDAIKVKEGYQNYLEEFGVREEDLVQFSEWMKETKEVDVVQLIQEIFTKQEVLTTNEIEERFENGGYTVFTPNDGEILILFEHIRTTYTIYGGGDIIMFSEFNEDSDTEVYYMIMGGKEKFATPSMETFYDLEREELEGKKQMSESTINQGYYLRHVFKSNVLRELQITIDELITFFAEYE